MVQAASAVMLPHIYPHVSAQLLSAVEQAEVWWEYVPWFDQLVAEPFEIVDGELIVGDCPGSGFDPDPDAVERLARTPWLPLAAG
jgi:L-alanine-DL-glutamate epimerase-like enolase superfamily enzyme